MSESGKQIGLTYACAIVSVAVAVEIRLLLNPLLGVHFPFATVFLAIIVTAWYGGLRPALASVLLGGIASVVFLLPSHGNSAAAELERNTGIALYLFTGLGISLLAGSMHAARRKEETAADSARRQASLIDQTHDPVFAWEWNGPITFWNRGAARLYGYSSEEATGRVSHELLKTELPGGIATLVGSLEQQGSWEGELHQITLDGRAVVVESRMVLIRDAGRAFVLEANRDITERKKAEAALLEARDLLEARVLDRTAELARSNESLQASEERTRLILEGVRTHAIFMLDPAGNVVSWNPGAERIKGYRAEEVIGHHFSMFYTPAEIERGDPPRALEVAARDGYKEEEALRVRKDGSQFWAGVSITALYGPDRRPTGFVKVTRDITQRKKAEEALRYSEERFTLLVDGIRDYAILMLDPEGHVLTWNEGAARIKGYSEKEIIGRHFSCFYPPDAVAAGLPEHELKIAGAVGKFEDEGWRVRRDGSRFWATVLITAVRDSQENLRGFSKLTRDTTERMRTEERFQRVVEASPSAMIIAGADGLITLANTQAEKLFGYDRRELLGRPIEMLVPARFRPHHPAQRSAFFAAPMARGMGTGRALFALRKDSSEVPVEIGLSPITTNDGPFVLASIIDITERKRFESELQARATEMEQFTYTVSHDLKSPLITIKSYISMIAQDLDSGKQDRVSADLQRISKAADKMQTLLEEVLALSRIGRVTNNRETLAFASLVAEALELVAGGLQQKNVRVEVAADLPMVTVDRPRMVEVLQNLVDNASKFMGSQPDPVIRIGSSTDGLETRFFVADNGIGLDPIHHERVFGLFDKLDPKSEGSGAGLAIAKRIVELHGGNIGIESTGSGGSTFWFTLKGQSEPKVTKTEKQ